VNDRVIEVYDVWVDGQTGPNTRAGRKVLEGVPADRIADVVQELARAHA
jgi:hypothetical protein